MTLQDRLTFQDHLNCLCFSPGQQTLYVGSASYDRTTRCNSDPDTLACSDPNTLACSDSNTLSCSDPDTLCSSDPRSTTPMREYNRANRSPVRTVIVRRQALGSNLLPTHLKRWASSIGWRPATHLLRDWVAHRNDECTAGAAYLLSSTYLLT